MFLDALKRRNPELLDAAIALHQRGDIPPNCTVLDLDVIAENTRAFVAEAEKYGLTSFAMTKQIGRNPDALRVIAAAGLPAAVGVDLECAMATTASGMRLGHIGHLVQIPRHSIAQAAALHPEFWTVFSEEKALDIARHARRTGMTQQVLLRVVDDGDFFYEGHGGGVPLADIVRVADRIDTFGGVRVAGVTSFPATLCDATTRQLVATQNRRTLATAKALLERSGRVNVQLNAPGTTSTSILAALAADGATQVEPGHGLTGTTPAHAISDLVELPAVAYVSEVSHLWDGRAYVFGGGLYVDPVLGDAHTEAIIVPAAAGIDDAVTLPVHMPAANAIDYYATIPIPDGISVREGDTVLFGFRSQVFVTRSLTAGISGVRTAFPHVEGTWSANGARPHTVPRIEAPHDRE